MNSTYPDEHRIPLDNIRLVECILEVIQEQKRLIRPHARVQKKPWFWRGGMI